MMTALAIGILATGLGGGVFTGKLMWDTLSNIGSESGILMDVPDISDIAEDITQEEIIQ